MVVVKIKGYEIDIPNVKSSFQRRALQFQQQIITTLRSIKLLDGYVDVSEEGYALKKAPASVTWYVDGHRLYYSYGLCSSFVENLYVVSALLALEIQALYDNTKTMEEFILSFSEKEDIVEERKEAREILGLAPDDHDLEEINKKYKLLAKESHPDMPGGSTEKFKRINNAHKTLKRELE